MTLKVGITGATGKMGFEVLEAVSESEDIDISFAVARSMERVNGFDVYPDSDFKNLLQQNQPDVVVDFTSPEATLRYARSCAETGTPLVTGTTGFEEEQLDDLREHSNEVPLLKTSNFSQGIQVLRTILKEAASTLSEFDIEIVESHHNSKKDSPSGTTNTIIEDLKEVRDIDRVKHGREGDSLREDSEIGVHSIRAGNIKGEHQVILAGTEEKIELSHEADSRKVFAEGALKAAQWLDNRDNGWYSFEQVL